MQILKGKKKGFFYTKRTLIDKIDLEKRVRGSNKNGRGVFF